MPRYRYVVRVESDAEPFYTDADAEMITEAGLTDLVGREFDAEDDAAAEVVTFNEMSVRGGAPGLDAGYVTAISVETGAELPVRYMLWEE